MGEGRVLDIRGWSRCCSQRIPRYRRKKREGKKRERERREYHGVCRYRLTKKNSPLVDAKGGRLRSLWRLGPHSEKASSRVMGKLGGGYISQQRMIRKRK